MDFIKFIEKDLPPLESILQSPSANLRATRVSPKGRGNLLISYVKGERRRRGSYFRVTQWMAGSLLVDIRSFDEGGVKRRQSCSEKSKGQAKGVSSRRGEMFSHL